VEACGEWPAANIVDNRVVIKPNLVVPMSAETGVTTHPEAVRALVDLALEAGALEVVIVEGGFGGANFAACGYDFFDNYDQRVRLLDLNDEPLLLVQVPGGLAYHQLYMPQVLLEDGVVFISAAKLKTHFHTHVTLTMKNLIGLAPIGEYRDPENNWRFVMHHRGINQVIVDLNLLRTIDFAVVEGIWAMEGDGPVTGNPVPMDIVLAGCNPVAVDRACLSATAIPQLAVKHLSYAARKGLGPSHTGQIEVRGDPFIQRPFAWPTKLPPIIEYPKAYPRGFAPSAGQEVWIIYRVAFPCLTKVEIVLTSEFTSELSLIRNLRDWDSRPFGIEILKWDGRNDEGIPVPFGLYSIRVEAKYTEGGVSSYATGWVSVTRKRPSLHIPMLLLDS
jgi:uncharacterized protein (DUF362 family)